MTYIEQPDQIVYPVLENGDDAYPTVASFNTGEEIRDYS